MEKCISRQWTGWSLWILILISIGSFFAPRNPDPAEQLHHNTELRIAVNTPHPCGRIGLKHQIRKDRIFDDHNYHKAIESSEESVSENDGDHDQSHVRTAWHLTVTACPCSYTSSTSLYRANPRNVDYRAIRTQRHILYQNFRI